MTSGGATPTVKARYDYLPFGEEIGAGVGPRGGGMGYSGIDATRQKFTQKERDNESGLDYFLARYYSSAQGRFTSVDHMDVNLNRQFYPNAKSRETEFQSYLSQPQHWNLYLYVINNPLKLVDLDGQQELDTVEKVALEVLKKGLTRVTKSQLKAGFLSAVVKGTLEFFFGPELYFTPGTLDEHEVAFAKEIMYFEGRSFTGTFDKNQPGIDGFLTTEGSIAQNVQAISLKETQGSLVALLSASSEAERQAFRSQYKNVDLYLKATNPNIDVTNLVDFATKGGLIKIPTQGAIKSITIFTNDGVVRLQGGKVFSCTKDGGCTVTN